jgi:hypothetical protein
MEMHLNPRGHALLGRELARFLLANALVSAR